MWSIDSFNAVSLGSMGMNQTLLESIYMAWNTWIYKVINALVALVIIILNLLSAGIVMRSPANGV